MGKAREAMGKAREAMGKAREAMGKAREAKMLWNLERYWASTSGDGVGKVEKRMAVVESGVIYDGYM